jgi:hypothetical protein
MATSDKNWYDYLGRILLIGALTILLGERALAWRNGHGQGDPRLGERVAHNEACIERIERGQERMDGKLDRIIERLPPR